MDIGFESFESSDFDVDVEEVVVKRTKRFERLWKIGEGGSISYTRIHEGVTYFGAADNYFYAVDVETGKELWRFRTGKYGISEPPLLYKNVLYQGTRDGILFAISLEGKELWRYKAGDLITKPMAFNDRLYFGSEDGYFRCMDMEGKEIWRFSIEGKMWDIPSYWNGIIIFGTWSCHVHGIDAETGEELWRFTTSNRNPSSLLPPYEAFSTEIKKETHIEEPIEETKYKKKKEETVSLSDYHVTSEYHMESDYKQKGEYDTSFVMFEGVLEGEEIWTSDSRALTPDSRILM